jgi:membrane protein
MKHRLKANWHLFRGVARRVMRANISLVAAGGAFFAMLSLFPALAAGIALLGFLVNPSVVDQQLAMLSEFIPPDAFQLIEVQVRRLVATNNSTLGWTTLISTGAALWSARVGTDAVIQAMNTVHDTRMRSGVMSALVALGITGALILVAIFAVLIMVVVPVVLAFLPLGPFAGTAITVVRWLLALAVVISGIWVIYRFAPTGPAARVHWISPGAVLTVLVWAAGSEAFSYYFTNFGSYNEIYGSIGAVIALMMFLYITIFVVLLGAAMNAELHEIRALETEEAAESGNPETSGGEEDGSGNQA